MATFKRADTAEEVVQPETITDLHYPNIDAKRFRAMFECGGVGVIVLQAGGRIQESNQRFQEMTGYTGDELQGAYDTEITHPDDLPVEIGMVNELMAGTRRFYHVEKRYIRKDVSIRWASMTAIAIRDEEENTISCVCIIEDITQRKRAEEALHASEERARAIFEQGRIGIAVANVEGRLLHANPAFIEMMGYTADELYTKTLADITHPEDRLLELDRFTEAAAVRCSSRDIEKRYMRKDGSIVWVRLNASVIVEGSDNPLYAIGIVENITERHQAKELLEKYQMLFENSRDIIFFVRLDGQIIEANAAAVTAYGYTREELLALSIFDLRTAKNIGQTSAQMAMADEKGILFETEHRRKDGSTFPVEVSARGADLGRSRVLLSIIRDITNRKRQELRQTELLQREQHIARTLQQALVPPSVSEEMYGYRFAVTYKPALTEAEIGGDFYDVFDLGDGRLCLMIGDVAGKGLRAAIRVAAARYAIRSYAVIEAKPSRILTLANQALCVGEDEEHSLLTAFLAIIDTRLGGALFSNAGHEPPVLLHPNGSVESIETTGIPLGILPEFSYPEGTFKLNPGSRLIVVTDGITEARTPRVDLFGRQRMIDHIVGHPQAPLQQVVRSLLEAAIEYAGGALQDDAAIVGVEYPG